MNYLKIVLEGWINPHTKKNYVDYILGKSKDAKKLNIPTTVFFDGLLSIVSLFEMDILNKVNERKKELAFIISHIKTNQSENTSLEEVEIELKNINPNDYYAHLTHITKNQYIGNLPNEDIISIKNYIESVKGYYSIKNKVKHLKKSLDLIDTIGSLAKATLEIKEEFDNYTPIDETSNLHSKFRKLISDKGDELTQPSQETQEVSKKQTQKLTQPQIALLYYYQGSEITKQNCDEIAQKYGHKNGEKQYQEYCNIAKRTDRKGRPNPFTLRKLENKIRLFKSVLGFLEDKFKPQLEDEISILESYGEQE